MYDQHIRVRREQLRTQKGQAELALKAIPKKKMHFQFSTHMTQEKSMPRTKKRVHNHTTQSRKLEPPVNLFTAHTLGSKI